nr:immunoglobulin heavy chain junction region [Mus musculus]
CARDGGEIYYYGGFTYW